MGNLGASVVSRSSGRSQKHTPARPASSQFCLENKQDGLGPVLHAGNSWKPPTCAQFSDRFIVPGTGASGCKGTWCLQPAHLWLCKPRHAQALTCPAPGGTAGARVTVLSPFRDWKGRIRKSPSALQRTSPQRCLLSGVLSPQWPGSERTWVSQEPKNALWLPSHHCLDPGSRKEAKKGGRPNGQCRVQQQAGELSSVRTKQQGPKTESCSGSQGVGLPRGPRGPGCQSKLQLCRGWHRQEVCTPLPVLPGKAGAASCVTLPLPPWVRDTLLGSRSWVPSACQGPRGCGALTPRNTCTSQACKMSSTGRRGRAVPTQS